MSRIVSWFSCGAASAVATKLAIAEHGKVTVAYCAVAEEHPDNTRFLRDCEKWFGQKIIILGNYDYGNSIYSVFEKVRFLSSPRGAPCTGKLKKEVRKEFEKPGDIHVFGYTCEEKNRVDRFIDANNALELIVPLIDAGLKKEDCLAMIENAGIELPEMYKLGYKNNNCRGCVKASSPAYWQKIKQDFPSFFEKMNQAEKSLGSSVCKIDMKAVKKKYPSIYNSLGAPKIPKIRATYWRPQLHELPPDILALDDGPNIQCGIFCEIAEKNYNSEGLYQSSFLTQKS